MNARGQRPMSLVCGCGRQYRVQRRGVVPARCPGCAEERRREQLRERHRELQEAGLRGIRLLRAADPAVETSVCGCGRDYLTLPLDHRCALPLRSS